MAQHVGLQYRVPGTGTCVSRSPRSPPGGFLRHAPKSSKGLLFVPLEPPILA